MINFRRFVAVINLRHFGLLRHNTFVFDFCATRMEGIVSPLRMYTIIYWFLRVHWLPSNNHDSWRLNSFFSAAKKLIHSTLASYCAAEEEFFFSQIHRQHSLGSTVSLCIIITIWPFRITTKIDLIARLHVNVIYMPVEKRTERTQEEKKKQKFGLKGNKIHETMFSIYPSHYTNALIRLFPISSSFSAFCCYQISLQQKEIYSKKKLRHLLPNWCSTPCQWLRRKLKERKKSRALRDNEFLFWLFFRFKLFNSYVDFVSVYSHQWWSWRRTLRFKREGGQREHLAFRIYAMACWWTEYLFECDGELM